MYTPSFLVMRARQGAEVAGSNNRAWAESGGAVQDTASHDVHGSSGILGGAPPHTQGPPAPDNCFGGSVLRLVVVEERETWTHQRC